MADAKITALTALTAASVDDIFPVVDDPAGTPVTKKITYANLIASFSAVGQLPFPATKIASAGANTLDDYEEGTWSVVPAFATPGTSTWTAPFNHGTYTLVGRVVHLTWDWYATLTKGTGSGNFIIPCPIAPNANQAYWYGCGAALPFTLANTGSVTPFLLTSDNNIYIWAVANNGGAGGYLTAATIVNGTVYSNGSITFFI
jgi:hypothetical protein